MADFRQYASLYPNEASLKNNNPAGISYFGDSDFSKALTNAGVKWSVGSARPKNEGAKYFSFDSVEDGMKAYNMLWDSGSYSKLKVQDALNRWGTGNVSANIDKNKLVKDLTPEEKAYLQVAQLAKESPGFLKELKKAGMIKEVTQKPGFLMGIVNEFLPTANASTTKYQFDIPQQNQNMRQQAQAVEAPDFNNMDSVYSFFDKNGFSERDRMAADEAVSSFGIDKQTALKELAKAKFKLLAKKSTVDGQLDDALKVLNSQSPTAAVAQAKSIGMTGVETPANEQNVLKFKEEFRNMPNEQFISMMNDDASVRSISEDQKQGLKEFMKEDYAAALAAGDQAKANDIMGTAQKLSGRLYEDQYDAAKWRSEILGQGGGAEGALASGIGGFENLKSIPVIGQIFKTVQRGATGVENVQEGIDEGRAWKAISGAMSVLGNAGLMLTGTGGLARGALKDVAKKQLITNSIAEGLETIAKTDLGGSILSFIASQPESVFAAIGKAKGISEQDLPYFIAAGRDAVLQAAIPSVVGAVKGAKAGLASNVAGSKSSRTASALGKGAAGALVEGSKAIVNPFQTIESVQGKVTDVNKLPGLKPNAAKQIEEATKKNGLIDRTVTRNVKTFPGDERIHSREGVVDAAEGVSILRKMGVDVKDFDSLADNVAAKKKQTYAKIGQELKDVELGFEPNQLKMAIENTVRKNLGSAASTGAASKTIDNITNQVLKNLTDKNGKFVAKFDQFHKVESGLYDLVMQATKDADLGSVNKAEILMSVKEAMLGELTKVPGFNKFANEYRMLSAISDVAEAIKKKASGDAAAEGFLNGLPPTYAGVIMGSATSGASAIAASATLASLVSYSRKLGKSPRQAWLELNKLADVMDQVGVDKFREAGGFARKTLGEDLPTSGFNLLGLASEGTPSAPIEKAGARASKAGAGSTFGFDQGVPVSKPMKQSEMPTGPMFGEKGFAESLGLKKVDPEVEAELQSLMKTADKNGDGQISPQEGKDLLAGLFQKENKPGRTENLTETAKLKAEVAAENAKAAKKPVKASSPAKKPSAAPKAKETPKKDVPKETHKAKIDLKEYNRILNKAKTSGNLTNAEKMQLRADAQKIGELDNVKKYLK